MSKRPMSGHRCLPSDSRRLGCRSSDYQQRRTPADRRRFACKRYCHCSWYHWVWLGSNTLRWQDRSCLGRDTRREIDRQPAHRVGNGRTDRTSQCRCKRSYHHMACHRVVVYAWVPPWDRIDREYRGCHRLPVLYCRQGKFQIGKCRCSCRHCRRRILNHSVWAGSCRCRS